MRKSVIGAATIALLSTTALVSAQQMQEPKGQPSAKEQGPAPGGKMGQSGSEKGAERSNGGADAGKGSASSGDNGNRAQSGDRGGDARGQAEKSDSRQDRKGSAQSDQGSDQRPDQRPDQRKGKAAETRDKAGDRKQDTARDRDRSDKQRDQAKQGKDEQRNQAQDKDRQRNRDQAQGKDRQRDDRAQAKNGQRDGGRVNLTQNQRGEVREKLSRHREARHTNVNFSINVGTRVPRGFRLQVIPTDIVSIVPAYRGYRYFIVNERVVIVDPTRYEIVEVIDVDGGPRRGGAVSASLDLSRDNIAMILDRLPNRRPADVRVDLALGAEVPSSVDLYEFPADLVAEIPSIRPYRYVVLNRSVLIVDPSGRDVVRVIDR